MVYAVFVSHVAVRCPILPLALLCVGCMLLVLRCLLSYVCGLAFVVCCCL